MGYTAIVVLADGETWTTADGCSVVIVSTKTIEALMQGRITIRQIEPIVELGIRDYPCSPST